jgi:hypothetical protein
MIMNDAGSGLISHHNVDASNPIAESYRTPHMDAGISWHRSLSRITDQRKASTSSPMRPGACRLGDCGTRPPLRDAILLAMPARQQGSEHRDVGTI